MAYQHMWQLAIPHWRTQRWGTYIYIYIYIYNYPQTVSFYIYLSTPMLGQDMTQGQFLSGVSLYHNSLVWLDQRDALRRDRTQVSVGHLNPSLFSEYVNEFFYVYLFFCIFSATWSGQFLRKYIYIYIFVYLRMHMLLQIIYRDIRIALQV